MRDPARLYASQPQTRHKIRPVALVVGLATKTCVESTARYAVEMGYHTTLLTDAVATFSQEEQEAAIQLDYPRIAHVVSTVDEFLASVE